MSSNLRTFGMIKVISRPIVLILITAASISHAQNDEFSIRILQDKRAGHSEELRQFLTSDNARYRELALLAVANIQDTAAFEFTFPLLQDKHPNVRRMAAFAVGMMGKKERTSVLFDRLLSEKDEKVIHHLFTAIGLSGSSRDLKYLMDRSGAFPDHWTSALLQAITRFANRKITHPDATAFTSGLLTNTRYTTEATYALTRINDTAAIKDLRGQLVRQMTMASPMIRMWSAAMLAVMQDSIAEHVLLQHAVNDDDWRVRVNAVRSLRNYPASRQTLLQLFSDSDEHVALASVAAYSGVTVNEHQLIDSAALSALMISPRIHSRVREEIKKHFAKKSGVRALPLLGDWRSDKPYISVERIKGYGYTGSAEAIPVIKEAIEQSSSSLVTIAGIEAYQEIARTLGDDGQKSFLRTAVQQFGRHNAGISYTTATVFQDSSFSMYIRKSFLPELSKAFESMTYPADQEPMVELLNVFVAIGDSTILPGIMESLAHHDRLIRKTAEKVYHKITGTDSPVRFIHNPDHYQPWYRTEDLTLLAQFSGADIVTSKGTIRVTFSKEAAPLTVLNFILLAQKKYYDGLLFHRVVSNFVIQGGDPLGNGSGGPNYAIRTEVHPETVYRTGAVGMASAGKDTEGSQWFVTHCPTPHLDFRYSIFGYTSHSAVVDRIMVGDTITLVTLF